MKLFLILIMSITIIFRASAHPSTPLISYLKSSDKICLAIVTSTEGKKITFTVTEIFRGEIPRTLTLLPYANQPYEMKSEWLLVSHPSGFKDCIGYAMKGDCEWIPGQIIHKGDQLSVNDHFPADTNVPLDHIKDLIKQLPALDTSPKM